MRDPYKDTINCFLRLRREWKRHGRIIVAVDFDDTVFDFHGEGHDYKEVLEVLCRCIQKNFYIMLFTGTPPSEWPRQKEFLARRGIPVNSVNVNPIDLPFGNSGKPYYNILLDDRAGLGQALDVLRMLLWEVETTREKHEN